MELFLQQLVNGLIIGIIYSLVAIGLTVIYGIFGILNMTQGTFFMIGAFAAFFLTKNFGISYFLSIPLAMVITGAVGILVERSSVRTLRGQDHIVFLLSTSGVMVALENLALVVWGATPRQLSSPFVPEPVVILGVFLTRQKIFLFLCAAVMVFLVKWFIKTSRIGRAMRAVATDQNAAALMGIDVDRVFMVTFGLGAALSAAAGVLLGPIFGIEPLMGQLTLIKAFVVVIMGGMGNITGAFYCGLILGVAENLGAGYINVDYKDAFGLIILVLVLLFRPQGLLGRGGLR
ncbi:MAG: branched-chain amino acid ABC transporter permease [Thermodesulfobacteriota bacterium]